MFHRVDLSRALVCLALLAGACAPVQTVLRDGRSVTIDEASRMDFQAAQAVDRKGDLAGAAALYQRILTELPTSSYVDDAMLRLAQINRRQRNLKPAVGLIEALLGRFPTSDLIDEARIELGKLYFFREEHLRAAETLSAVRWKKVPPAERSKLEEITRSALEKGGTADMELRWLIDRHDSEADASVRAALAGEISSLLDRGAVGAKTLEAVAEAGGNAFPADLILIRLAMAAGRTGDIEGAKRFSGRFLRLFPGHPRAGEVIELRDTLTRFQEVDPMAVGVLLPLSGAGEGFGRQALDGMSLAAGVFDQTSDSLSPRLFIEDSGESPEQAREAFGRLLRERRVLTVVGPLLAKQSQAVAEVANELRVPVISMSASEGVTEAGEYVFRSSVTKSAQAAELARVATDVLGVRRAAILYPSNRYGQEFMAFFWKEFTARGGEIRAAESYDPEATTFDKPIKRMTGLLPLSARREEICRRDQAPAVRGRLRYDPEACYRADDLPPIIDFEAVFIPDGPLKARQIAPALAYHDVRGVWILGTNSWNSPEITTGDAERYLQGAVFLDGFFKGRPSGPGADFMRRFYNTFGREPSVFEAEAFDTVSMVLDVIRRERPGSRQAFAKGLRRVRDYPGVTGEISFPPNRDALRSLTALTLDGGRIVEIE